MTSSKDEVQAKPDIHPIGVVARALRDTVAPKVSRRTPRASRISRGGPSLPAFVMPQNREPQRGIGAARNLGRFIFRWNPLNAGRLATIHLDAGDRDVDLFVHVIDSLSRTIRLDILSAIRLAVRASV